MWFCSPEDINLKTIDLSFCPRLLVWAQQNSLNLKLPWIKNSYYKELNIFNLVCGSRDPVKCFKAISFEIVPFGHQGNILLQYHKWPLSNLGSKGSKGVLVTKPTNKSVIGVF